MVKSRQHALAYAFELHKSHGHRFTIQDVLADAYVLEMYLKGYADVKPNKTGDA